MQRIVSMRGLLSLCLAVGFCAACSRAEDTGPAVGTLQVELSRTRVAQGSPVDMKFKFTVANDAPSLGDRRVFVHFLDADEELMWTDDHEPPTPTSQWKPGQTVEYTRTVFVPIYPYVGQARVVSGLYEVKSNDRLKLSLQDRGDKSYQVAAFELLPQTENVFLIFKDGWHPAEVAPENPTIEWQWTRKDATLAFRNPKRDSILFLQMDNPSSVANSARQVEVRIGDQVDATLPVVNNEAPVRKIALSTAQLGTGDMVEVRLTADRTFVPALEPGIKSNDTRELGVRVFHAFVQPQS